MKVFCFLLFFSSSDFIYAKSYFKCESEKTNFALSHFLEYKREYQLLCKQSNCPTEFVLAIVLPEISNFNSNTDFFETKSSEIFYGELGSDYGNFSLGFFQMKPTFLEDIEFQIKLNEELNAFERLTIYRDTIPINQRKERLDRIRDLTWRTKYLCAFYQLMEIKYNSLRFDSELDKLLFYATAFNHGFMKGIAEIRKWTQISYFPDRGENNDFVYGEVAQEFYLKLITYE